MSALEQRFKLLKKERLKALLPFFTCGYPDEATFIDLVKAASECGADAIEIGLPFSDPLADGPTIQRSSQIALDGGLTVNKALRMISWLSSKVSLPLVVLTYANLIYQYGLKRFVLNVQNSGVSGIIAADLVVEESRPLRKECVAADVNLIHLAAPTTNSTRLKKIAEASSGFIYLVSVIGVTGARRTVPVALSSQVKQIRIFTEKPVCVGFGISDPGQAKKIAQFSDGIIVGSALVDKIRTGKNKRQILGNVSGFLTSLKKRINQ